MFTFGRNENLKVQTRKKKCGKTSTKFMTYYGIK